MRYAWPGNVRELRSAIQHGQIVCDGQLIHPADLPGALRASNTSAAQRLAELQNDIHLPPTGINLPVFLGEIERGLVREALEYCHGNQVQAAALLGLSRDQLRYRMPSQGKDDQGEGKPRPYPATK